MDPYLEGELWSSFHHELTLAAKHQLAPKIEPRYFAFTEKYFLTESSEGVEIGQGALYPDVGIAETGAATAPSTTDMAVLAAPVEVRVPLRRRVPHHRITIRDVEKRRLVTVVEFLSPTNKKNPGRRQYLRRRERILDSTAHLVEIDLLRRGRRLPIEGELPPGDYFAYVCRAEARPKATAWPMLLTQPLLWVPIPLLAGDPDVSLDLQQAVATAFNAGRFRNVIDYSRPFEAALTKQQREWAEQMLRTAGHR
jgi:hypothetical protein